jgi:hypothetical protein
MRGICRSMAVYPSGSSAAARQLEFPHAAENNYQPASTLLETRWLSWNDMPG